MKNKFQQIIQEEKTKIETLIIEDDAKTKYKISFIWEPNGKERVNLIYEEGAESEFKFHKNDPNKRTQFINIDDAKNVVAKMKARSPKFKAIKIEEDTGIEYFGQTNAPAKPTEEYPEGHNFSWGKRSKIMQKILDTNNIKYKLVNGQNVKSFLIHKDDIEKLDEILKNGGSRLIVGPQAQYHHFWFNSFYGK